MLRRRGQAEVGRYLPGHHGRRTNTRGLAMWPSDPGAEERRRCRVGTRGWAAGQNTTTNLTDRWCLEDNVFVLTQTIEIARKEDREDCTLVFSTSRRHMIVYRMGLCFTA
ncbi:hypothetical protein MRX96_024838 [Rhipicephalus microplus]